MTNITSARNSTQKPNSAGFGAKKRVWLFVLPSLTGISIFFFIPVGLSLMYAFTNTFGDFVFFRNFADVLGNTAFRLAATNSIRFIAVSVPLNMIISFILAQFLQNLRYKKLLALAFMIPMIIPSGSIVFFWNTLFADNGAINSFLFSRGMDTISWLNTDWSFTIILVVFLFKNLGFNVVLFMAGFQLIPKVYYEMSTLEGCGVFKTFCHVTFVYIIPTTFLVLMMSIINSFRIFREIYLLFGPYPHQSVYMLQHFMNNQFIFANMQRLSVTATLISAVVIILVLGIFHAQKKTSETFY
ncbi:MAG: sugar ABC transporter permease [Oscillospiraceae bacterium]|nr:sugar ABC transporter permease [Oscillospiraceae bacterium]